MKLARSSSHRVAAWLTFSRSLKKRSKKFAFFLELGVVMAPDFAARMATRDSWNAGGRFHFESGLPGTAAHENHRFMIGSSDDYQS